MLFAALPSVQTQPKNTEQQIAVLAICSKKIAAK